ncbi:MAG: hypothetical protein KJ573_11090 [Proteobacteria bacterium]|nr:hypothetical protein [Pseudomonadota bacterium]
MAKPISIREFDAHEAGPLLADKRFGRLKPVSCTRCGKETGFTRRLFEITGVPKSKQRDDETQNLIRFHFNQQYSIEFVFFKGHGRKFFVDSALCSGCGSTAVAYDIEFDDDLFAAAAKLTGKSQAETKKGVEEIYEKLRQKSL